MQRRNNQTPKASGLQTSKQNSNSLRNKKEGKSDDHPRYDVCKHVLGHELCNMISAYKMYRNALFHLTEIVLKSCVHMSYWPWNIEDKDKEAKEGQSSEATKNKNVATFSFAQLEMVTIQSVAT